MNALLLGLVTLGLTSCATGPAPAPYASTVTLMDEASQKCKATVKDDARSQKECFPVLKDKQILIKVTKIYDKLGVRIIDGVAGRATAIVHCEVDVKTAAAIDKDPKFIAVGQPYWVKGDFTGYARGLYQYYTLSTCTIAPYGDSVSAP